MEIYQHSNYKELHYIIHNEQIYCMNVHSCDTEIYESVHNKGKTRAYFMDLILNHTKKTIFDLPEKIRKRVIKKFLIPDA